MRESAKTEESNPSKQPCRLVLPMYIVERFPFLSIWTYLYCVRATKEKNFIYKWRGTYYSFSYNLALGISKILTLRLALRLFEKSSNNRSAVYIVLAIWDRMNCCTSTTWRGSRGEGECVLLRLFQSGLHTEQNEWIYTLKYVYIHPYVVFHLKYLKRLIFRNGGSTWLII